MMSQNLSANTPFIVGMSERTQNTLDAKEKESSNSIMVVTIIDRCVHL